MRLALGFKMLGRRKKRAKWAGVSVREPDAGELHVRFDEQRGGNGP